MSGAFLGSLVVAAATLAFFGTGIGATDVGLQLTARWSYCFFIPAYAGGALATIFGPALLPLARRGRDLGLAFASAHLTHAGLVAWLYYISPHPPLSTRSAIFFGSALLVTYALALFSFPKWVAKLPPRAWWALRTFGMDYIALAFVYDLHNNPFNHGLVHLLAYLPFFAIGIAALLLRAASYAKRLHRWWRAPRVAGSGSARGAVGPPITRPAARR